jgi:hypothetical protein
MRVVAADCSRWELVVDGRLGPKLVEALDGFEVVDVEPGATRLQGWVVDRSALYGVLATAGDLGMELRSVRRLDEEGAR